MALFDSGQRHPGSGQRPGRLARDSGQRGVRVHDPGAIRPQHAGGSHSPRGRPVGGRAGEAQGRSGVRSQAPGPCAGRGTEVGTLDGCRASSSGFSDPLRPEPQAAGSANSSLLLCELAYLRSEISKPSVDTIDRVPRRAYHPRLTEHSLDVMRSRLTCRAAIQNAVTRLSRCTALVQGLELRAQSPCSEVRTSAAVRLRVEPNKPVRQVPHLTSPLSVTPGTMPRICTSTWRGRVSWWPIRQESWTEVLPPNEPPGGRR